MIDSKTFLLKQSLEEERLSMVGVIMFLLRSFVSVGKNCDAVCLPQP